MTLLMFLLESASWDAIGIGGGGVIGAGGFLYLLKRMFEKQEVTTRENTKAVSDLTLAFTAHRVGVTKDIEVLNESTITIRKEMHEGFKSVERRMDKGAEKHKEFEQRIDKQSDSIKNLTAKLEKRNGANHE